MPGIHRYQDVFIVVAGAVIGSRYRKAYDTHAPLFWESEPPPAAFAHMPIPRSSKARLSPRISFISKLHIGHPGNFQALSGRFVQFGGFFFRPCGARRSVEGTFQSVAFGHCRCGPGDKSGSPPLLDFSLKVKRNSAHNQSSAFVDAPVLEGLNARDRLKVRSWLTRRGGNRLLRGRTVANAGMDDYVLAQVGSSRLK